MIKDRKKFTLGLVMLIGFFAVVVLLFMPVSDGKNVFNVLDDLYNSVSKSSAYFIEKTREEVAPMDGRDVAMTVKGTDSQMAQQMVVLFEKNGATAEAKDKSVKVEGDLGTILNGALDDSDALYFNRSEELQAKYGFSGQEALNDWWNALNSAEKDLNAQSLFEDAKASREVREKGVEPSYNYFGITAKSPGEEILPVMLSLGGYILYTLWYGFALLFMFEGWGMKLEH